MARGTTESKHHALGQLLAFGGKFVRHAVKDQIELQFSGEGNRNAACPDSQCTGGNREPKGAESEKGPSGTRPRNPTLAKTARIGQSGSLP